MQDVRLREELSRTRRELEQLKWSVEFDRLLRWQARVLLAGGVIGGVFGALIAGGILHTFG